MNYTQYQNLFEEILRQPGPSSPYDDSKYIEYVRLNQARMKRWDKVLQLPDELLSGLSGIDETQHWIIITEPWCAEAAHIVPFLVKMTAVNPLITYDIQLRDSEPLLIMDYLTNGAKAIPRLIVRDTNEIDLFAWGPRPMEAQLFRNQLSAAGVDAEAIKFSLQQWYNADKGKSLNTEIMEQYTQVAF
jgi:thioredoxin family protein